MQLPFNTQIEADHEGRGKEGKLLCWSSWERHLDELKA
jgi:hypothetical protein